MASSDRAAVGVLDYCREHNIQVPQELSIIGYDNLAPAIDLSPALTTVDNPVTKPAFEAAGILIDLLENKISKPLAKWLDTGFVIRESSGICRVKE